MMYGLESSDVAKKNIILEKVQVESACRIQRLPRNIAKPVLLANIGWLSVTPLLHISQLVMLYRVLLLPSNNLIRQVVVTRVISLMYSQELVPKKNNSGPVYNALLTFKRYSVLHKVDELLMTMSQGKSIVKWKLFVNKLVIEEVTMTWNNQRYMYRSLELYNECVVNMNVSVWWKVSNAIPTLAKKIMKMLKLICQGKFVCPNRATYEPLNRCQLCNSHDLGNVCHVLFECTVLSAVRTPHLVTVYRCMPAAMNDCFKTFSNRQKTVFYQVSSANLLKNRLTYTNRLFILSLRCTQPILLN